MPFPMWAAEPGLQLEAFLSLLLTAQAPSRVRPSPRCISRSKHSVSGSCQQHLSEFQRHLSPATPFLHTYPADPPVHELLITPKEGVIRLQACRLCGYLKLVHHIQEQ